MGPLPAAPGTRMPWLEPALAAAAVLMADQTSKNFILARPVNAAANTPRRFFDIYCIINRRGAALPPTWRLMRTIAFMLCAIFAVAALTQEPLRASVSGGIGIGLALGGIVGNFIDLDRRGGIVDFIAIGPLPVCNIADLAIAGGLTLAGLAVVLWIWV